jgi:hypothetical protein
MKKPRHGLCVFCGSEGEVTDDHVPPQCVFPEPRHPQVKLIKVPACQKCNGGSSTDDEAFKVFVSLKAGMDNQVSLKLHESTRRTVQKNQRIKRDILKNSERFYLPANVREGFSEVSLLRFDPAPVRRVLRKVVLGLYYHHFGAIICNGVDVSIDLADQIPPSKEDEYCEFVVEIQRHGQLGSIGVDREFHYRYAPVIDNAHASVWLFAFYQRAGAVGYTIPKNSSTVAPVSGASVSPS